MNEPAYVSLPQLAAMLNLHIDTVRLHHRKGFLKAERVTGARGLRVRVSEARRWAAKYHAKALNLEGAA